MEKEKGLGSIPYFHAIIDLHFVEHHSPCFCRISIFAKFIWIITFDLFLLLHNFSETLLTICDWTACFPAAWQFDLSSFSKTEQGIQKYPWHREQVYFALLKQEEQDCSFSPAFFLNLVFWAWQLRKNERYCGKNYKFNVCMYALGSGTWEERRMNHMPLQCRIMRQTLSTLTFLPHLIKTAIPNWFKRRSFAVLNLPVRFGTWLGQCLNRAQLIKTPNFSCT